MAFPQVDSQTAQGFYPASTTHNVTMPATVAAGDLLIVVLTLRSIGGTGYNPATPSGWTRLFSRQFSSQIRCNVYAKLAIGDEDGDNVNFATILANEACSTVFRITAASWASDSVAASVASADNQWPSGDVVDPPSLAPGWGAEDILWICGYSHYTQDPSDGAAPTGYSNRLYSESRNALTNVIHETMRRELNAATEDPSGFYWTGSTSGHGVGFTLAIRPAGAPPPPPEEICPAPVITQAPTVSYPGGLNRAGPDAPTFVVTWIGEG